MFDYESYKSVHASAKPSRSYGGQLYTLDFEMVLIVNSIFKKLDLKSSKIDFCALHFMQKLYFAIAIDYHKF